MVRFVKSALVLGLGMMLATQAAAQRPGRPGGFSGFGGPGALLANRDVAKELKLSDEQVDKVREVVREVREKHKDALDKLKDATREERREKFSAITKAMAEDTSKALASVLNADQAKRLKQLEVQMLRSRAFSNPEIQKALDLSDEQKEKIRTLSEDADKSVRELFQGGNPREAMEKLQAHRKETMEKVMAVLSDAQKKTWKELTGEPFEFNFQGLRRPDSNNNKQ
jgi:Spy/CpxP family protein refolding chaperone